MTKDQIQAVVHAPYFLHPQPELAPDIIRFCRGDNTVGVKTILLALIEAHPDRAEAWRREFQFYVEQAERVIAQAPPDSVGWNDFHMVRWLVLGEAAAIPELVRRSKLPGRLGELARWMVTSMRGECLEFDKAFCTHLGVKPDLASRYAMKDGGPLAILRPENAAKKVAGLKMLKPCMPAAEREAAMNRLLADQPHLFVGWLSRNGLEVLDGWAKKRFNVEPGDSLVGCGAGLEISLPDFML